MKAVEQILRDGPPTERSPALWEGRATQRIADVVARGLGKGNSGAT
jgi:hypothetical protein